jgi:hypothetical protein
MRMTTDAKQLSRPYNRPIILTPGRDNKRLQLIHFTDKPVQSRDLGGARRKNKYVN